MIKHALSLYIALFLAAGPVAAQVHEAAVSGKGATPAAGAAATVHGLDSALPGLPGSAPGLTGALTGGASPIIAFLEGAAARPESLRALAANPTIAGGYVRALIAAPVTPEVRAEAVRALGASEIARLEAAVKTMSAEAAGSAKASASLKAVAAEFAALGARVPGRGAVAVATNDPREVAWGDAQIQLGV